MKLTNKAIRRIDHATVMAIGSDLQMSERWVKSLIAQNKPNGPLTTYRAVEILRERIGLPVTEILVDERKIQRRRAKVQ